MVASNSLIWIYVHPYDSIPINRIQDHMDRMDMVLPAVFDTTGAASALPVVPIASGISGAAPAVLTAWHLCRICLITVDIWYGKDMPKALPMPKQCVVKSFALRYSLLARLMTLDKSSKYERNRTNVAAA